ncbi:HTH-type transcriptional regulator FrlR [Amycolatopsis sp. YIM 10]|nr:HTH-type transcriptional regulator FrlR [Amycolatopsis sp. YIM 10]
MYMIGQGGGVGFGKRNRLVDELAGQITSGRLAHGDRLPGENELARRYSVSRGTVRSALSDLQHRGLITTQTGVGSFVTFDDVELDQVAGWAKAFERGGVEIETELLGIERVADAELTRRYGLTRVTEVRRLRRDPHAGPVSLETAYVPLPDLPDQGLVEGSLTKTLRAAGLRAAGGEQWISTEKLDTASAALLEREPGELFLHATRSTVDASGGLVEHVVSLLDPARFRFHLTFPGPVAR